MTRSFPQLGRRSTNSPVERVSSARQAVRASDDLAAIGHEIRDAATPVAVVGRLLETLHGGDAQLASYGQLLSRQAELLVALASRLSWAAYPTEEVNDTVPAEPDGPVNVYELVEHSVQVAEANVRQHDPVQVDMPGKPLWVRGDFGRLSQVFVNLLISALRNSSPQGTVAIGVARAGRYCYVRVSDNGMGIPPDEMATIVTRYVRSGDARMKAHRGMGVGLAVVREIVTAHGGAVTVFSEGRDHGSEFVVRLPLLQPVSDLPVGPRR